MSESVGCAEAEPNERNTRSGACAAGINAVENATLIRSSPKTPCLSVAIGFATSGRRASSARRPAPPAATQEWVAGPMTPLRRNKEFQRDARVGEFVGHRGAVAAIGGGRCVHRGEAEPRSGARRDLAWRRGRQSAGLTLERLDRFLGRLRQPDADISRWSGDRADGLVRSITTGRDHRILVLLCAFCARFSV